MQPNLNAPHNEPVPLKHPPLPSQEEKEDTISLLETQNGEYDDSTDLKEKSEEGSFVPELVANATTPSPFSEELTVSQSQINECSSDSMELEELEEKIQNIDIEEQVITDVPSTLNAAQKETIEMQALMNNCSPSVAALIVEAQQQPLSLLAENDKSAVQKKLEKIWDLISPVIDGAMGGFASLSVIQVIAGGFESWYPQVMRASAKYPLPIITLISGVNNILEQRCENYSPLWGAAVSGVNLTAFTSELFFFTITEIVRGIRHSGNLRVTISDAAAWSIIGVSLLIGMLEGVRIYAKGERENLLKQIRRTLENPLFIKTPAKGKVKRSLYWLANNPLSRRTLTGLGGAAITHALIDEIEQLINVDDSTLEKIIRYGSMTVGGLASAFILGMPEPEKSQLAAWLEKGFDLSAVLALALSAYHTFTFDNHLEDAKAFWQQDTLTEQSIFWPVFTFTMLVIQLSIESYWYCKKTPNNMASSHLVFTPTYAASDLEKEEEEEPLIGSPRPR